MRITFISDTHGLHKQLKLPEADMIVHAGDISSRGLLNEVNDFLDWFSTLPYQHKVFIGGNHDFLLEKEPDLFKQLIPENLVYLENKTIEIEGIKIWGSPATPWFHDWAFNYTRGVEIQKIWTQIPANVDILLTHGPAYGFGDTLYNNQLAGCKDLLESIQKIRPAYHVFGHIHEAYGVYKNEHTTFVNASCVDFNYRLVHKPMTIDFSKP